MYVGVVLKKALDASLYLHFLILFPHLILVPNILNPVTLNLGATEHRRATPGHHKHHSIQQTQVY